MNRAEIILSKAFPRSVEAITQLVNPDFSGKDRREVIGRVQAINRKAEEAAELAGFKAAEAAKKAGKQS